MALARPDPVRRAYLLDRRNLLAAMRQRAVHLRENGYTVTWTDAAHVFMVKRSGDQTEFLVDPVAVACTCPFHRWQIETEPLAEDGAVVPCKHLLGLGRLVESTLIALREEDDYRRYFPLAAHWAATRSALRNRNSRLLEYWPSPEERRKRCHLRQLRPR